MASLTPGQLQRSLLAARNTVFNKFKLIPQDRSELVWLNFMRKHSKSSATNGGVVEVLLKKNGGLRIEHFSGSDRLSHHENDVAIKLTYEFKYSHMGLRIVHEELENSGFVVMPNQGRSKNFAKMSNRDADLLMNLLEERTEDMDRSWDEELDKILLRDGSLDPKAPIGLDGLVTVDPTTGTIGGKSRSNPLLQHQVDTTLTVGTGGNIRKQLTKLRRNANVNNVGVGGKIDFIMVGAEALDGYTGYMEANGLRYNRDASKATGVDIGIPDTDVQFENIPMVHNPTFEILDGEGYTAGTIPMTKRIYMLNSRGWHLLHPDGKMKFFSAPFDSADRRITLMDLDGRHAPIVTKPNSNALGALV